MKQIDPYIQKAFDWLTKDNGEGFLLPSEHCPTRDIFQARLDHLSREMESSKKFKELYSLIVAVVGEIGNNAFDHNLGSWKDEKGIYFVYDLRERFVVIADRGRGILATLKRVRPKLQTENQAIKIAFTEKISGRAPEQRGNGLKFVESVARKNNFKIDFYSGDGAYIINNGLRKSEARQNLKGVLAILYF